MAKTVRSNEDISQRFGEVLAAQREARGFANQSDVASASVSLAHEGNGVFESFSQQWLSRLESDTTGERIDAANRRKLRTLSYLLGWSGSEFEQRVGVPVGTVPRLENNVKGEADPEPINSKARVRIPLFEGLSSGILGFEKTEPSAYLHVSLDELPGGSKNSKLFFVDIQETDLFDETLAFPIPVGARLLAEAVRKPEDGKLVIAYLPVQNLGVVTKFNKKPKNVLFRSYEAGGDVFWSSDCPELGVAGVVRNVCYDL